MQIIAGVIGLCLEDLVRWRRLVARDSTQMTYAGIERVPRTLND